MRLFADKNLSRKQRLVGAENFLPVQQRLVRFAIATIVT